MTTIDAIKSNRYDYTAVIGVLVAVAPDAIAMVTDASIGLSPRHVMAVRVIGLLLAAWGKSVAVRQ